MATPDADNNAFQVYLEEYKQIRAEVLARIQTQNQAINYVIVIMAAAITAVIAAIKDGKGDYEVGAVLMTVTLFLPLITAPLAFIFFDNEIKFHQLGALIWYDRRPKIVNLASNNSYVLANTEDFSVIDDPDTPGQHKFGEWFGRLFRFISFCRYLIFLPPTLLPVVAQACYVFTNGHRYVIKPEAAHSTINGLGYVVFALDVAVTVILILTIIMLFISYYRGKERFHRWTDMQRQKSAPAGDNE